MERDLLKAVSTDYNIGGKSIQINFKIKEDKQIQKTDFLIIINLEYDTLLIQKTELAKELLRKEEKSTIEDEIKKILKDYFKKENLKLLYKKFLRDFLYNNEEIEDLTNRVSDSKDGITLFLKDQKLKMLLEPKYNLYIEAEKLCFLINETYKKLNNDNFEIKYIEN